MNRLEARHFDPLNISAARQIELTNARRHIRCPATPLEGFFWLHVMLLTDRLQLRRLAPAWMVLLAFLLLGLLAGAEDSKSPSNDKEVSQITVRKPPIHTLPIQVDVNMVLLNVTVTDPYDRVVTGLEQSNFRVFDDKVEQEIASFSTEDAPISVGMIIDTSGSMVDKIQKSRQAVLQFFKTANPQDEFMLINFSERLNLVSGFTSKLEDLQARLLFVKAAGRTALLDAIYFGLGEMKKASTSRKALLIISDGGENHSRYTEKDIKQAVKEADVEMYAVGIFEPLASRARTLEEAGGPELLADLSQISGGRLFSVEDRTSCQILWRRFRLSCVTSTSLDTSPQTWSPMGAGGASRSS